MARRFTIGRDTACDVPVADESVSRRHAEICLTEEGSLMIADLHSSNGTRLVRNGTTAILSETTVRAGDQVQFGVVTMGVEQLVGMVENRHPGALTMRPRIARVRCSCGVLKTPGEVCLGCGGSNG